jgi:hypothetical protein
MVIFIQHLKTKSVCLVSKPYFVKVVSNQLKRVMQQKWHTLNACMN